MRLQFDPNQAFQLDAVAAVVDLFDGQPQGPPEYSVVAHATRQLEKRARSLPPGGRIKAIVIGGTAIDLDPPVDPPRGGPN